ncbi:hypothetical protein [Corynebacterium sp. Marseille-P3884]|uniref:hypothetical protein n=1 Tax=Corynebacterium sp. Marseille-P3884 TaxID=2495409 RepID=UPI001B33C937|nr:hypothetical protein [Corynebacterium sp. Marseille-P3884]MBP3948989.1 hypothetical protein [Corynebacterium sp. Marseille-P3884]
MNAKLKGSTGSNLHDPRTRLMRGWAAQFILTSLAAAGTNHILIIGASKDGVFTSGPDPKRPDPPKRRRFVSEWDEDSADFDFHKNRRTRAPGAVPAVA